MKIEPRGKFGGIKVHLDAEECKALMAPAYCPTTAFKFTGDLTAKLKKLLKEEPQLLVDKSPEEVKKMLEYEAEKAQTKLKLMNKGTTWDPKEGIDMKKECKKYGLQVPSN